MGPLGPQKLSIGKRSSLLSLGRWVGLHLRKVDDNPTLPDIVPPPPPPPSQFLSHTISENTEEPLCPHSRCPWDPGTRRQGSSADD